MILKLIDKALDQVSERLANNLCDNIEVIRQQEEQQPVSQTKVIADIHYCEDSQTLKPDYDKPWQEPDPELEHLLNCGHWQQVNDVAKRAYLSA